MKHLIQIFDKLNLSRDNGLFVTSENDWNGLFSNRVERLIKKTIEPDAFFCIDNKPFILFFENLGDKKKSKLKDIWNFNESPIIIISEQNSIEIYNGFKYLTENQSLALFGKEDKLNDFKYFELVTGKTWEKYQDEFGSKNRIDHYLLNNIESARDILLSQNLSSSLANSLIGKIIFVRYLIDRDVKLDFEQKGRSRKWTNTEFCDILSNKDQIKNFFNYLKDKFNGDLFPVTENEIDSISDNCFSILIDLLSGDIVGSGQKSLFDLYDFSIIPVEFISNVYEIFIGQDQQEKQGAYYTPLFLVDYILAETVENKIKSQVNNNCRVLDPSCGSGIFLVETLRKIIEKYQSNNLNYADNANKYQKDLKKLASENIFGVDKDESAVNVAIFSIYLTLLDYQEPSDIETFKFPHLLTNNFFVSDFFNTKSDFNNKFNEIDFDFILGNPPWKGNSIGDLGKKYIQGRKKIEKQSKKEFEIAINNGELAEGFLLRVSDFASKKTNIALIIRSQILYNPGYKTNYSKFRQYFLQEFYLDKIFELAPARREIFVNAIAPACVLFYRYAFSNPTVNNETTHISLKPSRFFSLFKVFTIKRNDFKTLIQKKLIENDWLWKSLVYGSYLDFNFIKRLKQDFNSINQVLENDSNLIYGTGIQFSSNEKEDSTHLIGKPFIDTYGINTFHIDNSKISEFKKETVHRKRDARLFEAPMLLIREGVEMETFRAKCAISEKNILFKDSIAVIKSLDNNKDILKSIGAMLQSIMFSYYSVLTFSSIGIERERVKNYNKFSLPFFDSSKSSLAATKIETLKKQKAENIALFQEDTYLEEINKNIEIIDNDIFNYLSITEEEESLINYAINVSIPLIKQQNGYENIFESINIKDLIIVDFAKVFLNKFNPIYKKNNQKLTVEVKHTDQIIGLFFNLIPLNSTADLIKLTQEENSTIIQTISSLGIERVTDKLFVQKDIRGFENDGFYIIKPNEKNLWHKAIAYLDVNEFMDAILTTGKNHTLNVQ